jgi:hypothetical protein
MEIVYCDGCGVRVSEADTKSGAAFRDKGGRLLCPTCGAAARAADPQTKSVTKVITKPASKVVARPHGRETGGIPTIGHPSASGSRSAPAHAPVHAPAQAAAPRAGSNPAMLYAGIGGGAGGLLLIALFLLLSGKKTEEVARPEPKETPVAKKEEPAPVAKARPPEPKEKPAPEEAKQAPPKPAEKAEAIDEIRESYAKRKLTDLKTDLQRGGGAAKAARRKLRDFVTTYASTAAGKEAAELLKQAAPDEPPTPTPAATIAVYRRDYKTDAPAPGWQYLWNEGGEIGAASRYKPLVWNGEKNQYSGDTRQYPGGASGWAACRPQGGHPGTGTDQGSPVDRFAIAAYTLQAGQGGKKLAISGWICKPSQANTGLELRVYAGDTLKDEVQVASGSTEQFVTALGTMNDGDTIYVGVGPQRADGNDSFEMDFTIYTIP